MTRTEAKDYILHHPEGYLPPAKKTGWVCPLCGNGSGSTGDGLTQDKKDGTGTHWKCFKCGFYGDAVELVAQVEGIQDGGSREAFEVAYKAYGLTVEPDHQQEPRQINNTSLQKYKIATTKVSNELPDFIFGEQAAVRVSKARKPKKQVYVILETAQKSQK